MHGWRGFHRLDREERLRKVTEHAGLDESDVAALTASSALSDEIAETFVENAVGSYPLPLAFAVGFVIDGEEVVVPMAVEESSVVAAACNGAKIVAAAGGFETSADDPITIGQIEIRGARKDAWEIVESRKRTWMDRLDAMMPNMVERGGGMRDIVVRAVGDRALVHLHVDTRDAMGANLVNTLCESIADDVAEALGGRPGLRILSNLATQRMSTASFRIPVDAVGGPDAAAEIVAANDLALVDPYRAATHNKGIMNGVDPVLVATGNDWRAAEAGIHAYAARDGQYQALTTYEIDGDDLVGRLDLPLAVGTVGGVTRLHPTAAACLKVLGDPSGPRLARIATAVGLAQNLAALRALSSEGIQKGHMRLHAANDELRQQRESPSKK